MKRLALLALLLLAPVGIGAHEGHTHRYMGTITAASDSQLSLKTTDGKIVTFKLDEKTRITKGKTAGGAKDLAPGERAVVEADGGKGPRTAKAIKLAASAKETA